MNRFGAGDTSVTGQNSRFRVTRWTADGDDRWATIVAQTPHANLAHAPEWFEAIRRAYGHMPLYLQAEDVHGQLVVLPAFFVRSRIFGTVVASMPFLDGGGPCGPSGDLANLAAHSLIDEAGRLGAGSVEFRSTTQLDLPAPALKDKVNMVVSLPGDSGLLWSRLDAKVRNQVRKAERSGLSVEFGHLEALSAFYDVFAVNMRDLGSPVHGRAFFTSMLEAFRDRARVALVRKGAEVIGGLIALAFKDMLVVPWASSLRRYMALCPNVLLYWETLAAGCREGFAQFDFGRSSRDSGTYRFKHQWGAQEVPLYCYQIPIRRGGERSLSPTDARGTRLVALWRRLPVRVTRWAGPRVRRYLTQ